MERSCYLLEFSVSPGGARLGDVHAGVTVDALRASVDRRYGGEGIDGYLIIWYGAVLRLWVVQEGRIVQGLDLHSYLRTGDERCDRTLERVIGWRGDEPLDWIMDSYGFDAQAALPLLTRYYEIQDAGGDVEVLMDDASKAPATYGGMTVDRLELDWDALARDLPPLREPVAAEGRFDVRWADPGLRDPESYLHHYLDPSEPESLHLGVNDLESGDDEYQDVSGEPLSDR